MLNFIILFVVGLAKVLCGIALEQVNLRTYKAEETARIIGKIMAWAGAIVLLIELIVFTFWMLIGAVK